MLSAAARPYIDASVPVLREHGIAITTAFYKNMFEAHPDLKNMFNMGNQANGSQQQSLASAVFAYAANIDNAAALAPVINRIVHKHAAVGLTAGHYPIVGEHLLGAIKQVLGDIASQELLDAWGEAYWLLANQLIDAEKELYSQANTSAGELMELVVIRKQQETEQITSLYLQRDGASPGRFIPGQYISVEAIFDEDNTRQLRQYSLSDSTEAPWWRISVKREEDINKPLGRVSNWIHSNIQVGSRIKVSKPFGDFALDLESHKPIALLSAGVGVTPMLSMLNTLRDIAPEREVLFAYATRNRSSHAHYENIVEAKARMPNLTAHRFYETIMQGEETIPEGVGMTQGFMDINGIWKQHIGDADIYLCGPLGFMQAMREALLAKGIKAERINREVFGPDLLDHLI